MRYSSFHLTKSIYRPKKISSEVESLEKKNRTDSTNITGIKKDFILLVFKLKIFKWIAEVYPNPIDWLAAMNYLFDLRASFLGNSKIRKIAKVQDRYYTNLFSPAINDRKIKMFILSELHRFKRVNKKTDRFNHVFLAITKKCPLQCEHCYEWERLNKKEVLNEEKLIRIIQKLQKQGVSQIYFTGGEPLLKFDLILKLLESAKPGTDFWLNTSGYQLTEEKAEILKSAGLTGLFISLDHYKKEEHDKFRNFDKAYYWATKAAENARKNGLVVCLSICVRKEFITEYNLNDYIKLGKKLEASFIQFIEPKPVGHLKNADVSLSKEHLSILETFFEKYNFEKKYREYPLICYHEYYQRRKGCLNKDNRGIYIDSNGGINACPFCHSNSGNILKDDLETSLERLKVMGCLQT